MSLACFFFSFPSKMSKDAGRGSLTASLPEALGRATLPCLFTRRHLDFGHRGLAPRRPGSSFVAPCLAVTGLSEAVSTPKRFGICLIFGCGCDLHNRESAWLTSAHLGSPRLTFSRQHSSRRVTQTPLRMDYLRWRCAVREMPLFASGQSRTI